jgi:hypothetical protein
MKIEKETLTERIARLRENLDEKARYKETIREAQESRLSEDEEDDDNDEYENDGDEDEDADDIT